MQRNIILTGFMGTGKSAVGKALARLLDYAFVDTDELIEARDGRTIAVIFADAGENAFRAMERQMAIELAGQQGLVISTGGGLMLDEINASMLGRNGRVFCLTAGVDEIVGRLAADGGLERPLLAGSEPAGRIAELLEARSAGYAKFEQVMTNGKMVNEVAEIIFQKIMAAES